MEIIVNARNSPTKMLIEQSLELYKRELKLVNSQYTLMVFTDRGMSRRDGMRGCVYKLGPRVIGMILDSALDMERLLITIAHEMVHVKQYARGQVKDSKNRKARYWLGKKVKAEYFDQPWEIEAYSKERVLANKIFALINKKEKHGKRRSN